MSEVCSDCRFSIQDFPDLFCTVRKLSTKDGLFVTCHHYLPKTVFDRITASPEVLAEKLTYWQYDPEQSRCGWTNNIIVGELYKNYHEAIAATAARLKEVCDAERH